MKGIVILAIIVIGFLLSYMITKKDRDQNQNLTKKGLIKLMISFTVIFLAIVVFVYWSDFS